MQVSEVRLAYKEAHLYSSHKQEQEGEMGCRLFFFYVFFNH